MDGKLTIEQFTAIITQLIGATSLCYIFFELLLHYHTLLVISIVLFLIFNSPLYTQFYGLFAGISTVSLTSVLMGRFADRDGDGYISADDIFAVQAMLMQRSEIFLKVSVTEPL